MPALWSTCHLPPKFFAIAGNSEVVMPSTSIPSPILQPSACLTEMTAPDEGHRRTGCGKRGWMIRTQDQVFFRVYQGLLCLRMSAPQHKNHTPRLAGDLADDHISKHLPAPLGMTRRLRLFDRQAGIQEQHTPLRPRLQTTCRRRKQGGRSFTPPRKLFEDIAKGRRNGNALRHRKG